MRAMLFVGRFLLAFLVFAPVAAAQLAVPDPQVLAGFAGKSGLRDVAGFVETVQSLRASGKLPPRYATKDEAAAHGWHGGGLCGVWPGHIIGGDIFRNFGRALPSAAGRVYREADLDADCRSRGPKRLIFATDGLIFVTLDHYNSFIPVP